MMPMPGRWSRRQVLGGAAVASVVLAIGAGLFVLGPPSAVRARRLDAERVDDLRQWARAIDDYWTENQQLPAALGDVRVQAEWSHLRAHDPATGEPYGYAATGAVTYELCAVFERPAEEPATESVWNHGIGRTCFPFEAAARR